MFDETGERSRSHGLRQEIIAAQAQRLGLVSLTGRCTWADYTEEYIRVLGQTAAMGITHVIFGDIMFDAHREWTERVCAAAGLTAVQPIWGEPTSSLAREFVESGAVAQLVTVRPPILDDTWLWRPLTLDLLSELEERGVDPCGENGEYHTLVTASPLFSTPLDLVEGERVLKNGCWAVDVALR